MYPSEHLGLPFLDDIPKGIIAAKIAAHAIDLAFRNSDIDWDNRMALARAELDWPRQFDEAIDSYTARFIKERIPTTQNSCSMCGDLCPFKLFSKNNRADKSQIIRLTGREPA